jgi:hypothetical protein
MREDGSMISEYLASPQNRLVRVHAVESIDGVSVALTVCKRLRANVEDPWLPFDAVRSDVWCDLCAEALGLSNVA